MSASSLPAGVEGSLEPGYAGVAEEFAAGLSEPSRTGAALSVWRDGREVVDVWAGVADERTARPWGRNTMTVLFSASKGLIALTLMRMAGRGEIDLDAPVRSVWPEFAAHGKGDVSVADVLAHRAGVSAPRDDLTVDELVDSEALAVRLAAQEPLWEPGTAHAYHAITYGTLAQEIVRRTTGRELHEVFADDIARPLDADVTLKATPDQLARTARIVTSPAWDGITFDTTSTDSEWVSRALTMGGALPRSLVAGDDGFNDPRIVLAGIAGAGGVGTASGLARIWSAVVVETRGIRLLTDRQSEQIRAVRSEGAWYFDPGGPYQRWGIGVQLSSDVTPWFSDASFGHDGAGGQSGVADPGARIGLGYVTNHMDVPDRVAPIIAALQDR